MPAPRFRKLESVTARSQGDVSAVQMHLDHLEACLERMRARAMQVWEPWPSGGVTEWDLHSALSDILEDIADAEGNGSE